MQTSARSWTTLGYIVAVLLLGGASAAGQLANLILQTLGAVLIAWTLWSEAPANGTRTGLRLFLLALLALGLVQFLPLPPALWQLLPGRQVVADGFTLAGAPLPWLAYSLDPWGSLQSLIWWIPPLAILVSMRAKLSPESRQVIWAVLGLAYVSVVMAAIQSFGDGGYLYAITNKGNGVGLFANSNHFGSFMLITIALAGGQWIHDRPRGSAGQVRLVQHYFLAALLVPLIVGVFLSQSLACALLLVPLLGGIALAARPDITIRWPLVCILGAIIAVGMVWLLSSGLAANDLMSKSETAGISRGEFLVNGIEMVRNFGPFGSGLGTFREIYPWYEDGAKIGTTYVNHAHNDLLELVIETGLIGLAVLALFLRWFLGRSWTIWNTARADHPVALTATLAIGVILLHSLVDYPMRTAAISGLIALCCIFAARAPDPRGAARMDGVGAGKRDSLVEI